MKRKTHEEYVEELKIKNPNIQVIGKYINANTKIMHRCLKHDEYWDTTPSRALSGVGCEKCHAEKIFKSKTRTHEDYVEQLKRVNPDIIPLEKFITINDPILHWCKKHSITWNVIPDNLLRGHGCSECRKEKLKGNNKKTHEQYQKELQLKFPTIQCVGKYDGAFAPISHKCIICKYEWDASPVNIINGTGCPKCGHHLKRTKEYYIDELKQINPQIELIGEFKNMTTHALHRCKVHDYCWNVVPNSIVSGTGCPICGIEKRTLNRTKKPEDFEKQLNLINTDIICLEKYHNAGTKIQVKCLKCNNVWKTLPFNLLKGSGCPNCNKSNGENIISDWLKNNNIDFIPQKKFKKCKDKRLLPFDFYLPTYNMAIEYDGEQHYKPIDWFGGESGFEYIKKHDQIKTQYCKDNGIKLLRISYQDDIHEKLNSLFI